MRKKAKRTVVRRGEYRITKSPDLLTVRPVSDKYASLTLLVEFDSAGLATVEIPVSIFKWTVLRSDTPVVLGQLDNRMPHRLVGLQVNLPDGSTKILR